MGSYAESSKGEGARSLIMVIDDSPTDCRLIESILRREGYIVKTGVDGQECFEILRVSYPDLILLDIVLPGINGFQICQRLKENPEYSDIPVIFISARGGKGDIVNGFEAGGVDYIVKPVNARELLVRIHNHIALKRSNDLIADYIEKLNFEYIEREKLDFLKDRFLAMISHDLKNPMVDLDRNLSAVLAGCNQTMCPFNENLHNMKRTLDYMRLLLGDLLDIAVIESGKLELNVSEVHYPIFLEEVLSTKRSRAADKGIAISCSFIDGLPPVYLDEKKMTQVINNLVENSLKFSPADTTITIAVDIVGRFVRTRVIDQGPGIPLDEQKFIFDKYKRIRHKTASPEAGSGLGLAIVKSIVEAHRGTVAVESEPGAGACFMFQLPLYFDL